jgi:hypothetical protein
VLNFQDKRSEVKKHFRRIGATGTEPIRLFIGQAPADLLPRLHTLAEQERPALIVVDMLAGVLPVKDLNDYAQVTQRFEPLVKLSRVTGATLLLLHHGSAHGAGRDGIDAALGSTAVSGSVDNVLVLRRTDRQRVLSSVQRIGPDLEPTIIVLNPETGRLERAGAKREVDDTDLGQRIVDALQTASEPVLESWIQVQVTGRKTDQVRVLRHLVGMRKVFRRGAGGRPDPYRYTLECSGSQKLAGPPKTAVEREPQGTTENIDIFAARDGSPLWEPDADPMKLGLFVTSSHQVPRFPIRTPEQEKVRTNVRRFSSNHVHGALDSEVPLVPEVPDDYRNQRIARPEIAIGPYKHASDSGSRDRGIGANDERF